MLELGEQRGPSGSTDAVQVGQFDVDHRDAGPTGAPVEAGPSPGAGPTVTIHAYSPPLRQTGQYGECEDGLLHRTPTDAEEQLKPPGYQGAPTR